MLDSYNSYNDGYKCESSGLMLISGANPPRPGMSLLQRADGHAVAKKVIEASESVLFSHVIYGTDVDVIALVSAEDNVSRIDATTKIRSLRNTVKNSHNFVADIVTMPIISMYGRKPTRRSWAERRHYCGWMFAKTPNDDAPADEMAEIFFRSTHRNNKTPQKVDITFFATLTGQYDIAIFIEADTDVDFDRFIDRDMPLLQSFNRSNTFTVTRLY